MAPIPTRDVIEREARARIIWGDSKDSVIEYLKSQGFGDKDAFELLQGLQRERSSDIRKTGIKQIGLGILLIIVSGVLFFLVLYTYSEHAFYNKGKGDCLGLAIFAGIYGLWKLLGGIFKIFLPQSEKGSLSSLDQ